MRRFRKLLLLLTVAIAVSIIPFLILSESFEEEITAWFRRPWSPAERFWLIVGLMAADIVIPVPSSAVSTYGGTILGFIAATTASWLGMSLGAICGFALGRRAGFPLIRKMVSSADLHALEQLNSRMSVWLIVLTRPLPILAEATVLLTGSLKLPWSRFLLPLLISNVVIAAAYSLIGAWSIQNDVTMIVIILSMILPLMLTWIIRKQLSRFVETPKPQTDTEQELEH